MSDEICANEFEDRFVFDEEEGVSNEGLSKVIEVHREQNAPKQHSEKKSEEDVKEELQVECEESKREEVVNEETERDERSTKDDESPVDGAAGVTADVKDEGLNATTLRVESIWEGLRQDLHDGGDGSEKWNRQTGEDTKADTIGGQLWREIDAQRVLHDLTDEDEHDLSDDQT